MYGFLGGPSARLRLARPAEPDYDQRMVNPASFTYTPPN